MRLKCLILTMVCLLCLIGCHPKKHYYQGYIEGEMLYLALPFSGQLQALHVRRGDFVKQDQLLYELDPKPQMFMQEQAAASLKQGKEIWKDLKKPKRVPEIDAIKAQIQQADAEISLAAIRVKRNKTLYDKHVTPKDTLDEAVEHLHVAQALKAQYEANLALANLGSRMNQINAQHANNKALQANLEQAKWDVTQKSLFSPAQGLVFDTYYRKGEFVEAGHPVMSLLTRTNTWVEFFVPLEALKNIPLGREITYLYPGDKESRRAKVTYIAAKAEYIPPLIYSRDNADKIVFRVKAAILGREPLVAGIPVTVVVETIHDK